MRLRATQTAPEMTNSVLLYRPQEYSFDLTPAPLAGYTSFLLDDLNIEVDIHGKVVSIWGMCPHTRWINTPLIAPKAAYGELFIESDTPLQRGVSTHIFSKKYLPTFVDRNSGWVQVRVASNVDSAVMVLPGVVFEISTCGKLCSLWLHPQSGVR